MFAVCVILEILKMECVVTGHMATCEEQIHRPVVSTGAGQQVEPRCNQEESGEAKLETIPTSGNPCAEQEVKKTDLFRVIEFVGAYAT